jgi:NAD(P)-dependent dehydrogenase (short-subunit alcohol dehydrogenase family)
MQDQLKDKNIIVTGANCGIGYEAALQFAKMGNNNNNTNLNLNF